MVFVLRLLARGEVASDTSPRPRNVNSHTRTRRSARERRLEGDCVYGRRVLYSS